MITRKDQARLFAVLLLQMDEFLDNIHHAVFLKDLFPQIGGRIAVGVGRIALAAVTSCAVAALIERQKIGVLSGKLHALVELEAELARVTVIHPLAFGVINSLSCILVFQFKGKDGNTIEHQHHVYAVSVVVAVIPLTVDGNVVGGIPRRRSLIQARFGFEVADAECDAPVLEAVAQNMEETVHIAGIVERIAEFFNGIDLVGIRKPHPFLGLRSLDKVDQRINKQPGLGVIYILALDISARRREQSRLNIGLKAFFVSFVNGHGRAPLSFP